MSDELSPMLSQPEEKTNDEPMLSFSRQSRLEGYFRLRLIFWADAFSGRLAARLTNLPREFAQSRLMYVMGSHKMLRFEIIAPSGVVADYRHRSDTFPLQRADVYTSDTMQIDLWFDGSLDMLDLADPHVMAYVPALADIRMVLFLIQMKNSLVFRTAFDPEKDDSFRLLRL